MLVSGMMSPSTLAPAHVVPLVVVASSTQAAASGSTTITQSESKAPKKVTNPNVGVESTVREYFADVPIMAEIAKCESHFRQFEKDGSIFRGRITDRDVGVMQVNEYYHLSASKRLGYDLHTIEGNMGYSRYLYNQEGTEPWISSSPCWMKSDVAKAMFETKVLAAK